MADESGVFRVMLRMDIRQGMESGFETTWRQIGETVTGHPANRGQWLSRSLDERGVYWIISDWADEPGFREFEHSAAHVEHRQRLHPFRSSGAMTTMTVVYEMRGAPVTGGSA